MKLCVIAALQDIKRVLSAPRSELNVTTASGKGRVAGPLQLLQPQVGRWTDCRSSTFSVPGDVNDIWCDIDHCSARVARHVLDNDASCRLDIIPSEQSCMLPSTSASQGCNCRAHEVKTSAKHVLVIEKEAVFRSLCEARIWSQLPVILVTASGMPDLATRAFSASSCRRAARSVDFYGLGRLESVRLSHPDELQVWQRKAQL